MSDFAYTLVPGKLKELLNKIRGIGVPQSATQKWLASLGYKSSNDRGMLGVLKQINFVDRSGTPTDLWKQYRGANHQAVLAKAITQGYPDLFDMYANAHARSDAELEQFVSSRTPAGKQVISATGRTFKALCQLADFRGDIAPQAQPSQDLAAVTEARPGPGIADRSIPGLETGLTVNINIQLTLPETTDETVYDKLFAALKRHLLS